MRELNLEVDKAQNRTFWWQHTRAADPRLNRRKTEILEAYTFTVCDDQIWNNYVMLVGPYQDRKIRPRLLILTLNIIHGRLETKNQLPALKN